MRAFPLVPKSGWNSSKTRAVSNQTRADRSKRCSAPLLIGALAILAASGLPAGSAYAVPFFKPFLPDFYQHQKSGPKVNVEDDSKMNFDNPVPQPPKADIPSYDTTPTWWENGGGWCCMTAYVNSFYFLENRYDFPGLFTRPDADDHTWQEKMIHAIEDMANDVLGLTGPAITIPQYMRKLEGDAHAEGASPHKTLTYSQFQLDGGKVTEADANAAGDLSSPTDVSSQFGSLFDVYQTELCKSQDVELFWTFPHGVPAGEPAPWWSGSFHTTTGAGVADCSDASNRTLWFADPDKRNADEAGTYLATSIRQPYPDDPNLAVPIGELHYEKVTLDADGCITSGIYTGACITQVTDISVEMPEPPAWIILTISLAGFGFMRNFKTGRLRA